MESTNIKEIVKEKYGKIASQSQCGCNCCGSDIVGYTVMSDDYTDKEGYVKDADLNLGCGIPTEFAKITEGSTVLDLGSGAGNDVFIARRLVGNSGKVIGVDMTREMIEKANQNNNQLGFTNVEFRYGEIEQLPVEDSSIDVVISNCVLNLVPDKKKAFSEIFRVLKNGGHFCISDIVLKGKLPVGMKEAVEMYAGCVAGALQYHEYMDIIHECGFVNPEVKKEKKIEIPNLVLLNYISIEELEDFKKSGNEIISITVFAEKS